jgi:hypothetical protein
VTGWRFLFRRNTFNADMADEFAFHMQARTEDLMRSGFARDEARRMAQLEFGSKERYSAECRESRGWHWADEMTRDVRYAWRNLRQSPAFCAAAIVPLALGLAAVAVMFAVVNTILLRPLPFARPDRVVSISQNIPFLSAAPTVVTADEFQLWQKSGLFESAAILDAVQYTLEGQGRPERIYGTAVTPDFFDVFKLQPMIGRGFSPADAAEGANPVIVLSHQLWARRFESDRNIIGRTVLLSGARATVIGVMPAGFDFPRLTDVSAIMGWAPEQSEFWTPLAITPKMIEAGNFNYYALGRLRDGVAYERAAAQLRAMVVPLFREKQVKYPEYRGIIQQMLGTLAVYVTPLRDTMSWNVRSAMDAGCGGTAACGTRAVQFRKRAAQQKRAPAPGIFNTADARSKPVAAAPAEFYRAERNRCGGFRLFGSAGSLGHPFHKNRCGQHVTAHPRIGV